jgi:hypothetical protein
MSLGPRFLIVAGFVLIGMGLLWMAAPYLRLGRLPGDFRFGGDRWRVYFPLGTSLLISLLLTIVVSFVSVVFGQRK